MEITTRELTEEEIANKAKAELFLIKLETRAKITANIGDNNDLIADINKRISILERITYQTLDYLYSQSELIDVIPAELQNAYGSLLNNYVNMISTGDLKDVIDLEDINNVFDKILDRINKTSIICKEYISQKEV
jgi:methionyl-tRNA synthetase